MKLGIVKPSLESASRSSIQIVLKLKVNIVSSTDAGQFYFWTAHLVLSNWLPSKWQRLSRLDNVEERLFSMRVCWQSGPSGQTKRAISSDSVRRRACGAPAYTSADCSGQRQSDVCAVWLIAGKIVHTSYSKLSSSSLLAATKESK